MGKELKVGETFYDGNDKLEVVEQSRCEGCYYCDKNCFLVPYKCSLSCRKDHKSVIFKQINDMETKEVKIEVPEGMEIDQEKSDLLKGKIAFKKKEQEVKTWKDLIGLDIPVGSSLIIEKGEEPFSYSCFTSDDRSVFIDERHAKSALAMAMISQLMFYYGNAITDEEWNNSQINKYTIRRSGDGIFKDLNEDLYQFLAFHTEEQRDNFLKYNEQLVKDYLMID